MKVIIQTRLTPPITVYDSDAPQGEGGWEYSKTAVKLLKPVVQVSDGKGFVYYKTGDFYPSIWPYVKYGAVIVAGYFIIRRFL